MDIFNDEFLPWQPVKLLLCSFGAWPFQSPKVRKILSTLVVFLMESIYIPEVIKFIEVWSNLAAMMNCLAVLVPHTLINISLFICLYNLNMIRDLLSIINSHWNEYNLTDREIKTLKQDGLEQRKTVVFYIFFVIFNTMLYLIVAPMIPKILDRISPVNESRPKLVPYYTEFFIDQEKYSQLFTIHWWIIGPFPTIIFLAYDILYLNFIQHACTMFYILECRFQTLGFNADRPSFKGSSVDDNKIYSCLVNCIMMHTNILKYTKLVDRNFSLSFLAILVLNLIGISGTAFQVQSDVNELAEKIRCSVNNVCQILHLYLLCWCSQKIINSSEKVFNSVYGNNWCDIPLRSQRLIIFILKQSREPCVITAGNFLVMSIETFSSEIKTAMSYLAVLRSMQ